MGNYEMSVITSQRQEIINKADDIVVLTYAVLAKDKVIYEKDERLAKAGLEIDRLKKVAKSLTKANHDHLAKKRVLVDQISQLEQQADNMLHSPASYDELEGRLQEMAVHCCSAEKQLKIQTQIAVDAVQKRIEIEEKYQLRKCMDYVKAYSGGFRPFHECYAEASISPTT